MLKLGWTALPETAEVSNGSLPVALVNEKVVKFRRISTGCSVYAALSRKEGLEGKHRAVASKSLRFGLRSLA